LGSECQLVIQVSGIHVVDPPVSYGLDWVKLKYQVTDWSGVIFSDELGLTSGGATGDGGWEADYAGSIEFQIQDTWNSEDPFQLTLWARAHDLAGHEDTRELGQYTMDEACDGK
jgi:hypothetical protein